MNRYGSLSNQSMRKRWKAMRFLTCCLFLPNLIPTSGVSVRLKALLPQNRVVSYRGRKSSFDTAEILRLRSEEKLGATEIAWRMGIGRATVYRALANSGQIKLHLRCINCLILTSIANFCTNPALTGYDFIIRNISLIFNLL